jgi:nucleotide-binding universal stress UspA family protein
MNSEASRLVALREALIPPNARYDGARREFASGKPVLFALFESDLPSASLATALAISDLFQSELHVLRILPAFDGINPLAPSIDQLLRALDHRLEVEHTTCAWLKDGLGSEGARERLKLRYGDPVDEIAAHAGALEAQMIIVAPGMPPYGRMVTALARAARVPVLVARARRETDIIVAATDLRDRTFPVLRTAAEFGQRLHASVVAIHNVGTPTPHESASDRVTYACNTCARRLRDASRRLAIDADVVISRELSSAEAILREARMRNVDLIVVGARARSWLERWTNRSVAARVVGGAEGSVLVTPLGTTH